MTQAESVHSTPPINTSATRRRFLSQSAGMAAGGAVLALVTIPPGPAVGAPASALDPVFALIAEKRAADVAHDKAIDTYGEFDNRRDRSSDAAIEAWENSAAACHYANEVDWKLATTLSTTLAGVAAVLRFANQIEDEGGEWPGTDTIGREGWHYQLRATMAAAIEAVAGKAVAS
jgi:hypothetical protein